MGLEYRWSVLLVGLLGLGLLGACSSSRGGGSGGGGTSDDDSAGDDDDDDTGDDDDAGDDDATDDDDDSGDDDDAGDDDDSGDDDDAAEGTASIEGVVTDSAGDLVANLSLTACSEAVCINGSTDSSGNFLFANLSPNTYLLTNLTYPGSDPVYNPILYSKFFEFVELEADEDVVLLHDLVVPVMENYWQIEGSVNNASLEDNLAISFDAGEATGDADSFENLEVPLGAQGAVPLHIGSRVLSESNWPQSGLGGATIVAAWALSPSGLSLDSGSFTVAVGGLEPSSSEYSFLYGDYEDGVVTGEFYSTASALTEDGIEGSISQLSVLMVVQNAADTPDSR